MCITNNIITFATVNKKQITIKIWRQQQFGDNIMAHFRSDDLHSFSFRFQSYGAYVVTYTTDRRGDYWKARIEDMMLIDATKNADVARVKDIQALYDAVKRNGTHYRYDGTRID